MDVVFLNALDHDPADLLRNLLYRKLDACNDRACISGKGHTIVSDNRNILRNLFSGFYKTADRAQSGDIAVCKAGC